MHGLDLQDPLNVSKTVIGTFQTEMDSRSPVIGLRKEGVYLDHLRQSSESFAVLLLSHILLGGHHQLLDKGVRVPGPAQENELLGRLTLLLSEFFLPRFSLNRGGGLRNAHLHLLRSPEPRLHHLRRHKRHRHSHRPQHTGELIHNTRCSDLCEEHTEVLSDGLDELLLHHRGQAGRGQHLELRSVSDSSLTIPTPIVFAVEVICGSTDVFHPHMRIPAALVGCSVIPVCCQS
mmetsp:Transcript_9297/g.9122  ORF Transcript_9297/g.9122 Transcript_9297/m.9122 type:complete len:233 (-) Transcript_9297:747-1445(-)